MTRFLATTALVAVCLTPGISHASFTLAGTKAAPHVEVHCSPSNLKAGRLHIYDGNTTDLNGAHFDYVDITSLRNAIRIEKGQSNGVISNSNFTTCGPMTGSNLPVSVAIDDGSNWLIQDTTASDFTMVPVNGVYLNGDCFSNERAAHFVTYQRVHATNCSNGAYDSKADHTVWDHTFATTADYCYRIWGADSSGVAMSCTGWRKDAVQLAPGSTGGVYDGLTLTVGASLNVVQAYPSTSAKFTNCKVVDAQGQQVYDGLKLNWLTFADGATLKTTNISFDASCSNSPPKPVIIVPPPVVSTKEVLSKTLLKDGTPGDNQIKLTTAATAKSLGVPTGTILETPPRASSAGYYYTVHQ